MSKSIKINSLRKSDIGFPIVPRNISDPASQFGNLRNAKKKLVARYKRIDKGMRQLIGTLDKRVISTNIKYEYQIDATRFQNINSFIQDLLYDELLDNKGGLWTQRWWLNSNLNQAYEDGTSDVLQSSKNIATVEAVGPEISREVRSIKLESIFFSRGFQTRLGLVHARVFEQMKGFSDQTRTDLASTLTRGMVDGIGIRELSNNITDRVKVSFSRAQRIARTEILNAYRTAGNVETDELNEDVYSDSEWGMLSLWFSALAPKTKTSSGTRKAHAIRHGSTYTTEKVREFYAINGNAINCLCSQSPVLFNKKTGEVLQQDLLDRMAKKRDLFLDAG